MRIPPGFLEDSLVEYCGREEVLILYLLFFSPAMTHQQHNERCERLLLFTLAWDHGIVIGTSLWLLLQTKPELVLLILSESSSESAFFVKNSVTMSSSQLFSSRKHTQSS